MTKIPFNNNNNNNNNENGKGDGGCRGLGKGWPPHWAKWFLK
jgi:hypothetical protein